ncbi:phage tail tape measure protein [Kaistia dalseonensis]|uniref:Phage-related minor tail protein n=1 Tax=Kaistia dalseonensis TaxID=410840 RepID=A0ABU0GZZ4_9HYPH|nr:phage tail tape measure protein [Kaistia dalseonensis]MCX5493082.1 phage tail tape measure protein [Kaistia dalseonensis]MDQ0435637.1 phage-related minor tail protein [Kaistia dalseonensis]
MPTPIDELSVTISADTAPFEASLDDLARRADGFSAAITRAFRSAVTGGKDFDDVLKGLALSISSIALNAALKPLSSGLGSLIGGIATTAFAKGGVVPFADGGVVASPTYFPLGGGLGLMGEAGAEAIMPLKRGADGSLGVAAGGGRAVTVNVAIQTQDVASFRRSEAQVAATLARAVGRGRRGL